MSGAEGDLVRLADLLGQPSASLDPPQRRLARVWQEALGEDIARNSQPRYLRGGRLVVATSSAVWAQTLQLMAGELLSHLNSALGEDLVRQVVFRPAGWDPGGGAGSPRALDETWGQTGDSAGGEGPSVGLPGTVRPQGGRRSRAGRHLTDEEETAMREISNLACDEDLGARIAAAMRASLAREGSD
jgi:hypothetical protein